MRDRLDLLLSILRSGTISSATDKDGPHIRIDMEDYMLREAVYLALTGPPASANTPCSHCGKPADTIACGIGGCPLGGDL